MWYSRFVSIGYKVCLLLVAGGLLIPHETGRDHERSGVRRAVGKVTVAGTALRLFALDHHDVFPERLSELVPDYIENEEAIRNVEFRAPRANPGSLPPRAIVVQLPFGENGQSVVMHADATFEVQ